MDEGELLGMRERMRDRGPDGAGLWFSDHRRVGLAHRRLSIIDLSEQGAQPMASVDGRYRVVFNGEIYNYRALRAELEVQGVGFRSHSDTEVLLALYAQHGPRMLERLRGMFAFAIWDGLHESLFLARDPYGVKPLYYADDGRTLRVASQVQALRAGGAIAGELDPAGAAGFFLFGSLPEPFTVYRSVRGLPAGSWLRAGGGRVEGPQRWSSLAKIWRDAAEAAKATPSGSGLGDLGEALRDSVRHHLVADVPVGAFLSSGIDSGALVGLMAEEGAAAETITVAFDEFRGLPQDEAPLAAELAAHFGVSHREHRVSQSRFRDDLPQILAAMDQPSIDGVNTWYAAQAARQAGLKVVISGLGGDELFGGYPAFADVPGWVRWFRLPGRVPGLGRTVRRLLSPRVGQHLHPKAAGLLEYGGSWTGAWLLRRGLFMPWELPALMGVEAAREGLERLAPLELIGAALVPDPGTAFGRVAAMEAGLYMRNQLLRDADWAGMAHGVEIRVPLVDVELLRRVAPVMLRPGQTAEAGKQALALAPRRALPEAIRQRRKTGFTVPFADWIGRIDGLDSWKREPALAHPGCHWSRRLAYALGRDLIRGL